MNTTFLDALADDMAPVRPLKDSGAAVGLALFAGIALAVVAAWIGIRPDVLAGSPHPMVLFRAGTLLLLGGICAASALATARPGVGRAGGGWQAALAMAAIVPLTAIGSAILDPAAAAHAVWSSSAAWCIGVSLAAATGFGAIVVGHLRRGAVVSPERASIITGLASGSLGVMVYSLHCPEVSIAYIGLWYSLTIATATLIARLTVPPLIRW